VFHQYSDGSERPIAYASRTLSAAQRNCTQIEMEGFSLIWGVMRFHKYLYGRQFTLVTDHKPLLAIQGSNKSLPTLAAARLQRLAIFLLEYRYNFDFRPTEKHCNAYGLSHLQRAGAVAVHEKVNFGASTCNLIQVEKLPLHVKDLQQATIGSAHTDYSAKILQRRVPVRSDHESPSLSLQEG